MEDLTSQFWNTDMNDRASCYKMRGEHTDQEKRRQDLLKLQKERRNASIFESRGILDLIIKADIQDKKDSDAKVVYKPQVQVPGFNAKKHYYAHMLMLSEWMTNVPEDFTTNWLVLPCPKGTRVLVISARGRTKAFLKSGHFYREWKSLLPGGKRADGKYSVLDGIIDPNHNVLYVLDVLVWSNVDLTNCELECRLFWLQSNLEEMDYLKEASHDNSHEVHLCPKAPCTLENLNELMNKWPAFPDNVPSVDGLLFYHKHATYLRGYSPLVVWLFPYMVNEVIGSRISVHKNYMDLKPTNYINQATFILEFEKKQAKKKPNSS